MDHLDMVEKLKEKTGVTYEEARAALEACDWDLLDAVVHLERNNKISGGAMVYTTQEAEEEPPRQKKHKGDDEGAWGRFFQGLGKLLHQSLVNTIEVSRKGEVLFSLPILVIVLLVFGIPPVAIPLIIVSLFFGFQYTFRGPNLEREDINRVMSKASEAADHLKQEVAREMHDRKERREDDEDA